MGPLTSAFTTCGELGPGPAGEFPPVANVDPLSVGEVGELDPPPHAGKAARHRISPAIFRMAPPALSQAAGGGATTMPTTRSPPPTCSLRLRELRLEKQAEEPLRLDAIRYGISKTSLDGLRPTFPAEDTVEATDLEK